MNKEDQIRNELGKIRNSLVFKRGNKCEICGCVGAPEDPDDFDPKKHKKLIVHHVKAIKNSGDNQDSNLQVVCWRCHSKLHNLGQVVRLDREIIDWLKTINPKINKALYYLKGKHELSIMSDVTLQK
jgi:5-methylcytosine-specific restriction endonuclease McrA